MAKKPSHPNSLKNLKPTGRPPGLKNKITTDLRNLVFDTAHDLNQEKKTCFKTFAVNNPDVFWGVIVPKTFPKDISVQAQIWTRELSDEELNARIQMLLDEEDALDEQEDGQ